MTNKNLIFDIKISDVNSTDVLNQIDSLLQNNNNINNYICVSNVHTTVMNSENPKFKKINNESFLSLPDGKPLVWYSKLINKAKNIERITGPDLMNLIFLDKRFKEYTHYFYGSTEENLEKLNQMLKVKYPGIKIVGMYSPPFRPLREKENLEIINRINEVAPNFIWVGLGAPKQEVWMYENYKYINNSILIGVGAAFAYHSGTLKRAPMIMQQLGLEWFYRLLQEPKRLFKRYLITNTKFILRSLKSICLIIFKKNVGEKV
ncbi:WecB/TagA/CpsF family glycosyltransferase [Ferdinandcohnia sp. Marseille-Q9671]